MDILKQYKKAAPYKKTGLRDFHFFIKYRPDTHRAALWQALSLE